MAAAEDQPALVEVMQEEQELNKIIKEQAHRAQISVLSQMQLQVIARAEEQEQELGQLGVILEQTERKIYNLPAQADVKAASERELPWAPDITPHASLPSQSPARRIQGLHEEMFDTLPSSVNTEKQPQG